MKIIRTHGRRTIVVDTLYIGHIPLSKSSFWSNRVVTAGLIEFRLTPEAGTVTRTWQLSEAVLRVKTQPRHPQSVRFWTYFDVSVH